MSKLKKKQKWYTVRSQALVNHVYLVSARSAKQAIAQVNTPQSHDMKHLCCTLSHAPSLGDVARLKKKEIDNVERELLRQGYQ